MDQYLGLIKKILEEGVSKDDRTGTGTVSIFGHQSRYNLEKGFPLVTTKRIHFKSIVHELLWFISGDTNIRYLNDNGVTIWNEWANEEGDLGPIYGKQWRNWSSVVLNDIKLFSKPDKQEVLNYPISNFGVGALGDSSVYQNQPLEHELYQTWYGMLKRCYNPKHPAYSNYGGAGVFVDDRWLVFSNFFLDVQKIINWYLKLEYPNDYSLDKDFYGSNKYGPDTCRWASKIEQSTNISTNLNLFKATDPDGYSTIEYGLRPFCDKYKLCRPAVSQVLNGIYHANDGWTFEKLTCPPGQIARLVKVDQLRKVIAEIKHNCNSRRMVVSAWNTADLPRMRLEPCHLLFQFYVAGGKLSCQLYQRSCDVGLGLPFNIASYALLTHMVAQVCNLGVGDFIHTFGDVHIYKNHIDPLREQIKRDPRNLPVLKLNPNVKNIDDFQYEDIEIVGYNPHPYIRLEVAV